MVLRLGEITLLDCVTSTQVITEVERNLAEKLPKKLPTLRLILSRSLRVVPDPAPQELAPYKGQADPKDLPDSGCCFAARLSIFADIQNTVITRLAGERLSSNVRAISSRRCGPCWRS